MHNEEEVYSPLCDQHWYLTTGSLSPKSGHMDVTSEPFSSTQCSRQLPQITWSQNQRLNQFITLVLVQSSHFTNAKTEAQRGKSDLSKVIQQDNGKAKTPVRPRIYFTLHQQIGDTTDMKHYTNVEKIQNFTMTMKSQHTSSGTQQGSSYHPTKEKTWGFWGQRKWRAKSWVKGGGGGAGIWQWRVFKLCFSNETNHWLFIF